MAIASAQPNNQSNAAPGRQAGKSLLANIVIIALLALAVFFYVRSVAPPEDQPAPAAEATAVTPAATAPVPATPAPESLTSVYGAAPARDSAPGLDPKLVDALQSVMPRAQEGATAPAVAAAPEPVPAVPEATPAPAAAAGAPAAPAEQPVTATPVPPAAGGLVPVPPPQIDLIRQVFAPEMPPAGFRP